MSLKLDDLNNDVLYLIQEQLLLVAGQMRKSERTKTRLSLSCVNWRMRRAVLPLIFRDICFDEKGRSNALVRFVTTFEENVELAPLIR